jgi:WD40 repeat protein
MSSRPAYPALRLCFAFLAALPVTGRGAAPPAPRLDRYGDPLPPGAVARMGSVRLRYAAAVSSLAYSPDGSLLAVGLGEGAGPTVRLWDLARAREVCRPDCREGISDLAFSPDGKFLVTADRTDTLRLWDPATGKPAGQLTSPKEETIVRCAFLGGGKTLATVEGIQSKDWRVTLWDVKARKPVRHIPISPFGYSPPLAVSPDGKALATGDSEWATVWDPATAREVRRFQCEASSLAFSPDSRALAAGGDIKQTVAVWDLSTGKKRFRRRFADDQGGVGPVAFSPDGKTLASGGVGGTVRLWDARSGREVRRLHGHQTSVTALAFSPDGKTLATGGNTTMYERDNGVRLWDVATGREVGPRPGHRQGVCCLRFTPDGRQVVSGSRDGTVRLWEAATGKEVRVLERFEGPVRSVALSRDGSLVASAGDEAVRVCETLTGKPRRGWAVRPGPLASVAFGGGGRLLAAGGEDGAVWVWDVGTGKEVRRFPGDEDLLTLVSVTPDGGKVWALKSGQTGNTLDATLAGWDLDSGRRLPPLALRPREVEGLRSRDLIYFPWIGAFSDDHKFLAGSITLRYGRAGLALGDSIEVWELGTGQRVLQLKGQEVAPLSMALSPDGRFLAAGYADKPDPSGKQRPLMLLWDLSTGRPVRELPGHLGWVYSLAFSSDGRRLASGAGDGTVLVWDLERLLPKAPLGAWPRARQEALWRALADEDGGAAYEALTALVASPGQAVALLRARLRPPRPANAGRIARLVADLDDDEFGVRERASAELAKCGELAEPALKEALLRGPSLEVRHRARALLGKLAGEHLRTLRAVAVLERIADRGSRALLRELAGGAPEARLTREAGRRWTAWPVSAPPAPSRCRTGASPCGRRSARRRPPATPGSAPRAGCAPPT